MSTEINSNIQLKVHFAIVSDILGSTEAPLFSIFKQIRQPVYDGEVYFEACKKGTILRSKGNMKEKVRL